jgi:hypothetical protein
MNKMILLLAFALTISVISACNQAAQGKTNEMYANPVTMQNFKGINKADPDRSKEDLESLAQKIAPESRPRILHLLYNDTGSSAWSPTLWWNYQNIKTGQPGC